MANKEKIQNNYEDLCFAAAYGRGAFVKLKGTTIDALAKALLEFVPTEAESKKQAGPAIKISLDRPELRYIDMMIQSGTLRKKQRESVAKAIAEGNKYPSAIHVVEGMGTLGRYASDGVARARRFEITPGMIAEGKPGGVSTDYVLVAREGEGVELNQGGGKVLINFKDLKSARRVSVPIAGVELADMFATAMEMFRAHMAMRFYTYVPFDQRQQQNEAA